MSKTIIGTIISKILFISLIYSDHSISMESKKNFEVGYVIDSQNLSKYLSVKSDSFDSNPANRGAGSPGDLPHIKQTIKLTCLSIDESTGETKLDVNKGNGCITFITHNDLIEIKRIDAKPGYGLSAINLFLIFLEQNSTIYPKCTNFSLKNEASIDGKLAPTLYYKLGFSPDSGNIADIRGSEHTRPRYLCKNQTPEKLYNNPFLGHGKND